MAYGSTTVPVRTKFKTFTATKTDVKVKKPLSSNSVAPAPPLSRAQSTASCAKSNNEDESASAESEDEDDDFTKDMEDDIKREIEEAEAKELRKRGKGKGKGKSTAKSSSSNDRRKSSSTFNHQASRDKKLAAQGFAIASSSSSDSNGGSDDSDDSGSKRRRPGGGTKRAPKKTYATEEEEQKSKHIGGKWRSKQWQKDQPWKMSKKRRDLEELYNPLIKLLDIKIVVVDSEGEHGGNVVGVSTDESSSEDEKPKKKKQRKPESRKMEKKTEWTRVDHLNTDSEDDVKPKVKPKVPAGTEAAEGVAQMEVDEPEPATDDGEPSTDYEEPETEDDEPDIVMVDVKKEETEVKMNDVDYSDPLMARALAREAATRQAEQAEKEAKKAELAKIAAAEKAIYAMRTSKAPKVVVPPAPVQSSLIKSSSVKSLGKDESNFEEKKQKSSKPHFIIKTLAQSKIGPLVLDKEKGVEVPEFINRFLRPYQQEGIQFLYRQYKNNMGGILGDDMGLGKTIQVIGFLSAIMGKTGRRADDKSRAAFVDAKERMGEPSYPSEFGPTCLIACPASVIHNWSRELKTWGYFRTYIFEGSEKHEGLKYFRRGLHDIIIASIEGVRNNIATFVDLDLSVIVIDEAHRVKNPSSASTIAFNQLPSRLRYGLTGTAIQNRLSEMWTLLDWANPGSVGSLGQWEMWVAHPLKFGRKSDATSEQIKLGKERAIALSHKLLPRFFVRRQKEGVLIQLPKKTDQIVICSMTDLQKQAYQRLLNLEDVQLILTAEDPCECGRTDELGQPFQKGKCCHQGLQKVILKYITLFQKVSNHLSLIYPNKEDLVNKEEKYNQDLEWCRTAFPEDHRSRLRNGVNLFDPSLCGKWDTLQKLLKMWKEAGDKVLIFSMSLRVLSLLEQLMQLTDHQYLTLDGSVPSAERMIRVDQFNNDPDYFCFLISTRAGGLGINLTSANRVVIFDPNWNPSHDLQAMDRAYRFGQTRDVEVFRLIAAGTLEELIYNRQALKRATANVAYEATSERRMFRGVEGEKQHRGELFGVKNIFRFRPTQSLTEMSIINCEMSAIEFAKENNLTYDEKKDGGESGEESLTSDQKEKKKLADAKALLGWSEDTSKTPEQLQAEAKLKKERQELDEILGGVAFVTISDDHLGSNAFESKVELHAIREGAVNKKHKEERAKKEKAEAPASWDPLARGKSTKTAIKPVSSKARIIAPVPQVAKAGKKELRIIAEFRRDRAIGLDLSNDDFGSPSGYSEAQLIDKLSGLDRDEQRAFLKKVTDKYIRSASDDD